MSLCSYHLFYKELIMRAIIAVVVAVVVVIVRSCGGGKN